MITEPFDVTIGYHTATTVYVWCKRAQMSHLSPNQESNDLLYISDGLSMAYFCMSMRVSLRCISSGMAATSCTLSCNEYVRFVLSYHHEVVAERISPIASSAASLIGMMTCFFFHFNRLADRAQIGDVTFFSYLFCLSRNCLYLSCAVRWFALSVCSPASFFANILSSFKFGLYRCIIFLRWFYGSSYSLAL